MLEAITRPRSLNSVAGDPLRPVLEPVLDPPGDHPGDPWTTPAPPGGLSHPCPHRSHRSAAGARWAAYDPWSGDGGRHGRSCLGRHARQNRSRGRALVLAAVAAGRGLRLGSRWR